MLSNHASRASTPDSMPVVPGLWVLRDVFVNLYYAAVAPAQPQGPWVLVDAGLPGSAGKIQRRANEVFGATPPVVILLIHGHFNHVSALPGLLAAWQGAHVHPHSLELLCLTGRSSYPPPNPTVGGGVMAYLSFLYTKKLLNLGPRVQALPADGSVPGLPCWRWLHTPGHTFGHVSFSREEDRVLVAGDVFTTVVGESGLAILPQK